MIKRVWTYVSNNALLSGLVLLGLGAWWKWSYVKVLLTALWTLLAGFGDWLMGTTEVSRVVLLADLLVLAALVSLAALQWYRSWASSAREAAPPGPPAAAPEEAPTAELKVTDGFTPSDLQLTASHVLLEYYPRKLQLPDLAAGMQQVTGMRVRVAPQAEIAQHMEAMVRWGAASIDHPGSEQAYYGLTQDGRDFMLDELSRRRITLNR
jgi:hypothetical protein